MVKFNRRVTTMASTDRSSDAPVILPVVDSVIPPLYRSWLHYDAEHKVLICVKCECPHAITRPGLRRHLNKDYKLKIKDYHPILNCIADLSIPDSLNDLPTVSDGLPARQGLAVIPGFRCTSNGCPYRTSGWRSMEKHLSMNHQIERRRGRTRGFENVSLQTWGRSRNYWVVSDSEQLEPTVDETDPKKQWMDRLVRVQDETQRKQLEHRSILNNSQVQDSTPWLDYTKWARLFLGKDIVTISETRLVRTDNPSVHDLFMISRRRLQFMCNVLDALISRCIETLESTPDEILHWLNSPRKTEPGFRKFELTQTSATLKGFIFFSRPEFPIHPLTLSLGM